MSEGSFATSGKIIGPMGSPLRGDNDGSSYARVKRIGRRTGEREWEKIVTDIAPMVTEGSLRGETPLVMSSQCAISKVTCHRSDIIIYTICR